jgi:hypothetical protein
VGGARERERAGGRTDRRVGKEAERKGKGKGEEVGDGGRGEAEGKGEEVCDWRTWDSGGVLWYSDVCGEGQN